MVPLSWFVYRALDCIFIYWILLNCEKINNYYILFNLYMCKVCNLWRFCALNWYLSCIVCYIRLIVNLVMSIDFMHLHFIFFVSFIFNFKRIIGYLSWNRLCKTEKWYQFVFCLFIYKLHFYLRLFSEWVCLFMYVSDP